MKDNDFEGFATETNRYAEQYFENNQNRGTFSRFRKWQNICASEIKRYIALILAMGIISQSVLYLFICFQQNMGLVYKRLPEEIQLQIKQGQRKAWRIPSPKNLTQ